MTFWLVMLLVINGKLGVQAVQFPNLESCLAALPKVAERVPDEVRLSCNVLPTGKSV